jgi:hypothetical protein
MKNFGLEILASSIFAINLQNVSSLNITYTSDPDTLPYTNWMSYFQEFLIGDLPIIPASHDTATAVVSPDENWYGIVGWVYARTQDLNIFNQLMLGIRYIDFRLTVTYDAFDRNNSIDLSHTFKTNTTLAQGLAEVKLFLELHPTETVFIMLRIDARNPLAHQVDNKQKYIQSVIQESNLSFSNFSSIASVRVKDVAGKAILLAPQERVFPVNDPVLPYMDTDTSYSVCDIWRYSSISAAQVRMAECFPQVPLTTSSTGVLTGYALDGQFDQLWPNLTSPVMNNWFFTNFQSNKDWERRKKYPMGAMMIDFVNKTYMSAMLDFTMNFAYPYPYHGEARAPWRPGDEIIAKSTPSAAVYISVWVATALIILN